MCNPPIGGTARQGIDTTAIIMEKLLKKAGNSAFAGRDLLSQIQGGHTIYLTRIGAQEVISHIYPFERSECTMDVLQFAIEMELEGERYYRRQSVKYAKSPLKTVFDLLAKDEAKHAGILRCKLDGTTYELKAHEQLSGRKNLFSGLRDYKPLAEERPDQATLYHTALEIEQRSIDLYTDLRAKAADAQTQSLFDFLVQEESRHYQILEDVFRFVNRPNEWVESAEFGLREEY